MSITTPVQHPLLACAAAVDAALEEVAGVEPLYMSAAEKEQAALAFERLERRIAERKLKVLAVADDVAEDHGARDVAVWFAHATHAEPAIVRSEVELAKAMDTRFARIQAGMAHGAVSPHQAKVIRHAIEELPTELGEELIGSAEAKLVELAQHHPPADLRRLGRRILEVVAPEIAEDEEARRLQQEEARAREQASLRFRRRGDGTTAFTGVLPDAAADRWKTNLEAFTSPRHRDHAPGLQEADRIPYRRKLAHAHIALLEHLDPTQLPEHGGDASTVIVTIPLEQLTKELGLAGLLDHDPGTGATLTAAEARRLACTAKIIPAVLGGDSEVLDLGRARRLFSTAQRKAGKLRDGGGCNEEACTVPAAWTEAHHDKPWSHGGKTDLKDLRHYCNHHHHLAHDARYTTDHLPNGKTRFHKRT